MIGYVGTACALISYQCKKNKNYFLFQTGCAVAFTVQFILLGAWVGMLLNLFSILRGVVMALGSRCKHPVHVIMLHTTYLASCLAAPLFFGEKWWMAALMLVAQSVGTQAMWSKNGKTIRLSQIFVVSPIWIAHNIYYFSIGGILCEVFNIWSVLVSFVRFKTSGFDKS